MNQSIPAPVQWTPAAPKVVLNPGETHLWFTDLDRTAQDETVNFLLTLLDDQEQERALRFRRQQLTSRFVAAHGRLRQILSTYLKIQPQAVKFAYGDSGKPALDPEMMQSSPEFVIPSQLQSSCAGTELFAALQFNLSHSDRYALIAVSLDHPVGVDLECMKAFPSASSLAKRFFSAQEYETLQALHDSAADLARSRSFLRHWVCKEAYVKATGKGLATQLNQVVIDFSQQARFEQLPSISSDWQVHEFSPSADTLGAVVIPQNVMAKFSYWQI